MRCLFISSIILSQTQHEGCDMNAALSNAELCQGCFTGCTVPPNTDIPLGAAYAMKTVFEIGEKVTFECKSDYCWSAGVQQRELHGACYCNGGRCAFGVCAGGVCTEPEDPSFSILQQGCEDCAGGIRSDQLHYIK